MTESRFDRNAVWSQRQPDDPNVEPHSVEGWFQGTRRPPGRGFTQVPRQSRSVVLDRGRDSDCAGDVGVVVILVWKGRT